MPRRRRLTGAVAVALLAAFTLSSAHADEAPRSPPPANRKSARVSFGLAVGGVAVCAAAEAGQRKLYDADHETSGRLVEGAKWVVCTLGPSAGQLYSEAWGQVAIWGGLRAAGFASVMIGHAVDDDPKLRDRLQFVGAWTVLISIIVDLSLAPSAARKYDARHAATTITPVSMSTPSGPAMGVALGGTF
ncbi:MAG: hypothetical protein F9K40_17440 [Kofleriaceae bacterium]|nr:MAG: hypothetical protein F9K40_17440 [Kofleriaceae bacterium]MBZ0234692.1 hypothetical protein [Kofleriaceae bacterium]